MKVYRECLFTLIDRKSRYIYIQKAKDRTSKEILKALNKIKASMKVKCFSVTFDNGALFSNSKEISKIFGCQVYYSRPYKSSDRGSNENANGMVRRQVPKKTNFQLITDQAVQVIAEELNNRPRKILGYKSRVQVQAKYLKKRQSV